MYNSIAWVMFSCETSSDSASLGLDHLSYSSVMWVKLIDFHWEWIQVHNHINVDFSIKYFGYIVDVGLVKWGGAKCIKKDLVMGST